MKTLIDEYDSSIRVSDRVVISDVSKTHVGEVGVVIAQDFTNSLYYNEDVFVLLMDSGERVWAFTRCLIKSPYQNEPLESVPSV